MYLGCIHLKSSLNSTSSRKLFYTLCSKLNIVSRFIIQELFIFWTRAAGGNFFFFFSVKGILGLCSSTLTWPSSWTWSSVQSQSIYRDQGLISASPSPEYITQTPSSACLLRLVWCSILVILCSPSLFFLCSSWLCSVTRKLLPWNTHPCSLISWLPIEVCQWEAPAGGQGSVIERVGGMFAFSCNTAAPLIWALLGLVMFPLFVSLTLKVVTHPHHCQPLSTSTPSQLS